MNYPSSATNTPERQILSVSELNKRVKGLLEIHLPLIWVEGEISNFSRPRSGHWYFTLKDEQAQVRAAMFRNRNQLVRDLPNEGDKVMLRARVSLYEGRGDFQIIVEHMEAAGIGLLQKQFAALQQKLKNEGLFDPAHKKSFPSFPRHLAVVTSPTGAALQDVLSVLQRRFPSLPITVVPASVQGDKAPNELIHALKLADNSGLFDAILLCRGGGSLEDLWAFNDENLARSIFHASTPVIAAVGHEVDFTIAEFVADYRAPTPSAAAEFISPNQEEILALFEGIKRAFHKNMALKLSALHQQISYYRARLKHPGDRLLHWTQQLDNAELRLTFAITKQLQHRANRIESLQQRAFRYAPQHQISQALQKVLSVEKSLKSAMQEKLNAFGMRLAKSSESLNIVSPLATLARGYAIVKNQQGNIVRDSRQLNKGETIEVALAEGKFEAEVTNPKLNGEK